MQTASLLIIGDEILSGRTQDKNLAFLANGLNEKGIPLMEVRVVPDDEGAIVAAINELRHRYSYVFTTGGIGATHDDITAACVAKAFGVPIERHRDAEKLLRAHYKNDINENRLRMADMPRGATLVDNPISISPAFTIGNVFVMAGVPRIMQEMFANILPTLKGNPKMLSKAASAYATEGQFASELAALAKRHPEVKIGSYPFAQKEAGGNKLGVTLIARATDPKALDAAYAEMKTLLLKYAPEIFEEDLAQRAQGDWKEAVAKRHGSAA
jgi:molybdenum cofactor synthesis domain-containing protein